MRTTYQLSRRREDSGFTKEPYKIDLNMGRCSRSTLYFGIYKTAMSIQKVFDKYASQYDASRRKLIPCFDDFYRVALEIVPFEKVQNITVLDLGAGTGLMAEMVALNYPNAKIILMDISCKMLSEARKRVERYQNEFEFIVSNYSQTESFHQNYDLIISSLSIHHLTDKEKQELFRKIYAHLKTDGIFINADQALGETLEIEKSYRITWEHQVRAAGATDEEINAALERMKEDKMSTLTSQLQWLIDTGFANVNCWYKNYSFAVYSGLKQPK
jgi:tRNA (cmo5U34)-methyltransferase